MKIFLISENIRSEEFKKWFGDWEKEDAYSSRNKDSIPSIAFKDSRPQVFYHGTTHDFENYEIGRDSYNSNIFGSWKVNRHAIFFTPDPNNANAFTSIEGNPSGGNIRPVYLNIRAPLDFREYVPEDIIEEFEAEGLNPRWLRNFHWDHLDGEDGAFFVGIAKKLGYDSVIFTDENPETLEDMETWAVFDKDQIRPAYS